jgi:uncharacterized protein with PhoU and TrkA domain
MAGAEDGIVHQLATMNKGIVKMAVALQRIADALEPLAEMIKEEVEKDG